MALSRDMEQPAAGGGGAEPVPVRASASPSRIDGALMPRAVRRRVLAAIGLLLAAALYLISVRGTAILYDLRDVVSAMCF